MANPTQDKILFTFDNPLPQDLWSSTNDTVMGGRSQSWMSINANGKAFFAGSVSLENNGGFASIRSHPLHLDLRGYQGLKIRVKGDGKTYRFSVKNDSAWKGINYYFEFETVSGEWMIVQAPFSSFIPKFRGRYLYSAPPIDPSYIYSVGFLIGDKQEGPFSLEIDWIHAATEAALEEKVRDDAGC
jgi:monofunctional biosynthetic peptidoglycan transglycosylase